MTRLATSPITFVLASLLTLSLGLATAASAQTLYAVEWQPDQGILATIDPADGSIISTIGNVTPVTNQSNGQRGLAMDPTTGTMYLLAGNPQELYTVDLGSAALTLVGAMSQRLRDIAFDDTGQLYGVSVSGGGDPNSLFTIDKADGTQTLQVALNGTNGHGLAFNPGMPTLLWHIAGGVFETIEIGTNTITPIGLSGTGTASDILALFFDPFSGEFRYFDSSDEYFAVTAAGVQSSIGTAGDNFFAAAWDQASTQLPVELMSFSID